MLQNNNLGEAKDMKKQLIIIGIIVVFLIVGLNGCIETDKEE